MKESIPSYYQAPTKLLLFYCIIIFIAMYPCVTCAQSDIRIYDKKINHLDKQKRKQGEWIFFNDKGKAFASCLFNNDSCIGAVVYYHNSDTAFVRIKTSSITEAYILYRGTQRFYAFNCPDSDSCLQVDDDPKLDEAAIALIRKYRDTVMGPQYYFAQKNLSDYISASFNSANLWFTKNLAIALTISSAGIVTNVETPDNLKTNNLSFDQVREINRIFSNMPRWQPLFTGTNTKESKFVIHRNSITNVH